MPDPIAVANYLRGLADAGNVEEHDRTILRAAANIVLIAVEDAITKKGE